MRANNDKKIFLIICLIVLYSYNISKKGELSQLYSDTITEIPPRSFYHKITANEARDMMASAESYIILDVRTEDEFKEQRIEGAILLPDYAISDQVKSVLPDKAALIFVYCRSGRRSANAANELISMGYKNVYDFGGIIDWTYETITN